MEANTTVSNEVYEQLKMDLASSGQELLALLQSLQPAQLAQPTTNPGWTVGQIISHLASVDSGMAFIAKQALAQPEEHRALMSSFDATAHNAGQVLKRADKSLAELIEEIQTNRTRLISLVTKLSPADLATLCIHPALGEISLYTMFAYICNHETAHANEIRQAVLATTSVNSNS